MRDRETDLGVVIKELGHHVQNLSLNRVRGGKIIMTAANRTRDC